MRPESLNCEIVAEAGVNHDGDPDVALALVDAAVNAGADAVKFQTFDPDELVTVGAPTAIYQAASGEGDNQADMLRRLVLSASGLRACADRARRSGIEFMSTPFDVASAHFLVDELGMSRIKVGSGELTNLPLILELARMGPQLILSTGMATMTEVEDALAAVVFARTAGAAEPPTIAALRAAYRSEDARQVLAGVLVMQCTTQYPAPAEQANLRVMDSYAQLGVLPGYSDHTSGIEVALTAVARGARMIEKHLTLDRKRHGPDHAASLEPGEFAALVDGIRRVETILGTATKGPVPAELGNMAVARRVLVATRNIAAGEHLGTESVAARRAGVGSPPSRLWEIMGQPASRAYVAGEILSE